MYIFHLTYADASPHATRVFGFLDFFFFYSSSFFWQKVVQFLFFSFPDGLVEINVTHNVCVALDQPFPRINERNNPK